MPSTNPKTYESTAPRKVAFLYGPLVLAGDLGPVAESRTFPYAVEQWDNFRAPVADVPVLVTEDGGTGGAVRRVRGNGLTFRTARTGRPRDVTLRPFNEMFYNHYNVYWDVLTPALYAERSAAMRAETARRAELDARTLDEYRPGEQQSEVDHGQKGEKTSAGEWQYRKLRHAPDGGWISWKDHHDHAWIVPASGTYVPSGTPTAEGALDGTRVVAAAGTGQIFVTSGGELRRFACRP